jgi:glucose/arabinose dehydrogenase
MRRPALASTVAVALAMTAAACSGSSDDPDAGSSTRRSTTTTTAVPSTSTTVAPNLAAARVTATRVADLERPTALAVRRDDPGLYLLEKEGRVRVLRDGALAPDAVLDISAEVGSNGNEEGLLGLAFSPAGTELYLYFTDRDGAIRVVEYTVGDAGVEPASRRDLLTVTHPQSNHNGGQLAFGPDGLLYVGTGDGGSAGDAGPGHVAGGNAQSTGTMLGKLLRIDPRPSADAPYTIPPGNPYVAGGGEPEIFAIGLRNPWRFSFDRETGDLWIGDVGQGSWEEIDMVPAGSGAGANFGWNRLEGTHEFAGDPPEGTVAPVFEYSHDGGNCAVTGGYVYRGAAIPDLRGAYVFADYCVGQLRAYGGPGIERFLDVEVPHVASFGEDAAGELYVLSDDGALYRLDPA